MTVSVDSDVKPAIIHVYIHIYIQKIVESVNITETKDVFKQVSGRIN